MAELVGRTRPRLLAAARRIRPEDAEDSVQSAYLSLVRRRDAAIPVHPWLLTAVIRLSYRRRAQAQHQQALVKRLTPRKSAASPIAAAISREEADLLRREVWKLPGTYRDALVLHHLQGLSLGETAQLLQLKPSTLRTRLQRGRQLLKPRVRIFYPLILLPWLLADYAIAAATLGGVMKAKGTIVAALIFIAAGSAGSAWLATRDTDSSRERAPTTAHATGPDATGLGSGQEEPGRGTADQQDPAENSTQERTTREQAPFAAGIVVDTSGKPIEGAGVFARLFRLGPTRRRMPEPLDDAFRTRSPLARTGDRGRFRVDSVPEGLVSIVFLRRGLAAKEVVCIENAKFDRKKGITHADKKSPGIDLRVVLDPGRSLTGVIGTRSGQPLARAGVTVGVPGLSQRTRTDAQGRYALHTLPRDLRTVAAYAGGFETERRTDIGVTEDFRLRPRVLILDVVDAVTRELIPAARGVVVRDGRLFTTLQPGGSSFGYGNKSAIPGRIYSLSSRLPEALGQNRRMATKMFVFAPGYLPWSDEVTLVRGETPPHLIVPLTPGDGPPAIQGQVRGCPTARVEVQYAFLRGPGGARPFLMGLDTGATGRFYFAGLPAGKYILVARAEGCPEVVREVTAPRRDIVFDLRPGATLVVATKVANTMIHVETLEGGRFKKQRTNADGVATFQSLAPGAYLVAAVIDGWNQSLRPGSPRTDVILKSGEATRIELAVPRREAVAFVVRDEAGAPFAGVVLSLKPTRGIGSGVGPKEWERLKGVAKTDADGRAKVELFAGKYDAELKFGTTSRVVAVAVPAKGAVESVLPRGGVTFKGAVRDATTGRGLSKCWIWAYSRDHPPKRLVDTRAGQNGEFEISGLSQPVMLMFRPMFPGRADGASVEYAMGFLWLDGDRDRELDVRLPPSDLPKPVTLEITAGAKTRLRAYAWAGTCWVMAGAATSDEVGRATLKAYAAPRYKVVAGKKEVEVSRDGDRVVIAVD